MNNLGLNESIESLDVSRNRLQEFSNHKFQLLDRLNLSHNKFKGLIGTIIKYLIIAIFTLTLVIINLSVILS